MESSVLDLRNILEIIFRTTKKRGNVLADCYLIKDPSIISKWKNFKAKPTNEDIMKIVEFAHAESTETQRKIMRDEIINLINGSYLKGVIRDSIINIEDFGEFLSEVLKLVTVVLEKDIQYDETSESKYNTEDFTGVSGVAKNMIQMETISAFSEGIEGKYSGVIEFNMTLSKDRGDGCVARFESDTKSNISKNKVSKPGKLQKKLKTTVVLGTLFVVLFAFLAVNAATNGQSGKGNYVAAEENKNAQKKEAEATPIPYEEVKEGKDTSLELQTSINDASIPSSVDIQPEPVALQEMDKNNGGNGEKVRAEESKPSKVISDSFKNTVETKTPTGESSENNTTEKNAEKGTENNTENTTTNNTTSNTGDIVNDIDNSGDTIIDGDVIIDGNENIVGKGSKIFISIQ